MVLCILMGRLTVFGVSGMLEGCPSITPCSLSQKDSHIIDILFPSIFAFVDKATRYMEDGQLTKVSSLYSNLVVEIYGRS